MIEVSTWPPMRPPSCAWASTRTQGRLPFPPPAPEDYRAAAWLTEKGADHNLIADLLTRELTAEQVHLLNDLMQDAATHVINGVSVVISEVIRDEYVGDLAVLVHKFIDMENLEVVFCSRSNG